MIQSEELNLIPLFYKAVKHLCIKEVPINVSSSAAGIKQVMKNKGSALIVIDKLLRLLDAFVEDLHHEADSMNDEKRAIAKKLIFLLRSSKGDLREVRRLVVPLIENTAISADVFWRFFQMVGIVAAEQHRTLSWAFRDQQCMGVLGERAQNLDLFLEDNFIGYKAPNSGNDYPNRGQKWNRSGNRKESQSNGKFPKKKKPKKKFVNRRKEAYNAISKVIEMSAYDKEMCIFHNSKPGKGGCKKKPCWYKHACGGCKEAAHTVIDCPKNKEQ